MIWFLILILSLCPGDDDTMEHELEDIDDPRDYH